MSATPKKRAHALSTAASADDEKMQITPPKNPKFDGIGGVSGEGSQQQSPSPSRLHYQMDALDAALNHYFSPKKRSPGRSPGRQAQRKLQFTADTDEEENGEEAEEKENKIKKSAKKAKWDGGCDFASLKRCFDILDEIHPTNEKTFNKHFDEWFRLLESGKFNILLHGLGSKRRILKAFSEFLIRQGRHVFAVNGLCAAVSVVRLFEMIADELNLEGVAPKRTKRKSLQNTAKALGEAIGARMELVVIIVQNIDSVQLRSFDQQKALATFVESAGSKVRLIASVDHVNAARIWDQQLRDAFGWLHYPISTLHCYGAEVMASGSRLLGLDARGNAKSHTMASLDVFWESTTSNIRKILAQLAVDAPTREERNRRAPLSIPRFCQILKNEFATTTETTLQQQLIEFCDHQLVQLDKDGNIQLLVNRQLLSAFLDTKIEN